MRWLLWAICIFLSGCVTRPERSFFQKAEGAYLALPAGSITENQAQVLADQYGALVRQAPQREIVSDIEILLASAKSWVIVITPANRDFMRGIFSKIKAPSKVSSATIQIYGQSTLELEKEMARLDLKKSVEGRPGDDK